MTCTNCGKASPALFCVSCRKSASAAFEKAKQSKVDKAPCASCAKEYRIETLGRGAGYCARCVANGKPRTKSAGESSSQIVGSATPEEVKEVKEVMLTMGAGDAVKPAAKSKAKKADKVERSPLVADKSEKPAKPAKPKTEKKPKASKTKKAPMITATGESSESGSDDE